MSSNLTKNLNAKKIQEEKKVAEQAKKEFEKKILKIANSTNSKISTVKEVAEKIKEGKLFPIILTTSGKVIGMATSKADQEAAIRTLYAFRRDKSSNTLMSDEEAMEAAYECTKAAAIAQEVIANNLIIDEAIVDKNDREHWIIKNVLMNTNGEEEASVEDMPDLPVEYKKKILLERAKVEEKGE